MARIVCDRDGAMLAGRFVKIPGKAFRCAANVVNVHAIVARAQNAAQAGGSELEFGIKPFLDLLRVIRDPAKLFFGRFVDVGAVEPELIPFLCVHVVLLIKMFRCL